MWKNVSKGELPPILETNNEWEDQTSGPLLVVTRWGDIRTVTYDRFDRDEPFRWHSNCSERWDLDGDITHWAELPEMPKD